ncbi:MAG: PH domain-containing protein [Gammaproteobacteria bacterium]|nr:PH domain-containing protein [Gammaproteobacteria bacterium]
MVMLSFILFCFLCVYFVTKYIKYTLTSERLQTHTGVFSKQTNDLELYRVIDTRLEEPFLLRLFGLGNIVLITADSSSPALSIIAIKDASKLRNNIRNLVESRRDAKKVREFM